ncbi:hypothetical protein QC761_0065990 [Podospora bellae-mahoneyi]|uniref:Uncharacterized protein n=1 Tax=Podospora bellae-mahoneyi TaxID=2093777 RepID=A0ABR0FH31_9PEZI|nr:hypothetical protein QC761_0065990 [Podospora bellae-mahoneyi]
MAAPSTPAATTDATSRQFLTNVEVPDWYTDSFIFSAHRPVTHSVKFSHLLHNLFSVPHFALPLAFLPRSMAADGLLVNNCRFIGCHRIHLGESVSSQSPRYRILRTMSFVVTGFSALAPITHAAVIFPYHQLDKQAGLRHYYIEEGIVLIGVVFYITRFPERWKPGIFDF